MNVVAVNRDIAEIDADAQADTGCLRRPVLPFRHAVLDLDGAFHGVYDGSEFEQQAIAHGFDDAAGVRRDQRVDQLPAKIAHGGERALLVGADQAGVADDVGGHDRGQSANTFLGHVASLKAAAFRRKPRE